MVRVSVKTQTGSSAYIQDTLAGLDMHALYGSTLPMSQGARGKLIIKMRLKIVDKPGFRFLHGFLLKLDIMGNLAVLCYDGVAQKSKQKRGY